MISVCVATYGEPAWAQTAQRAVASLDDQDPCWFSTHHELSGTVSSSRNAAAAMAPEGDWLCFLDADDELAPGYIGAMEKMVAVHGSRPNLLFTPAVQTVRGGRTAGPPSFFKEVPLRDANWLVIGTVVHRDLFWEVGGFDDYPHGWEDFSLWSKCVRAGAAIVKVPDAVYRYHANPQSKHRENFRDKKLARETHDRVIRELDAWEAAR